MRLIRVGVICILLYSVLIVLRHPHKARYESGADFVFSKGNAPAHVRANVLKSLHQFQDGYTQRDVSVLQPFMEQLFSQDNILVLGTQPREVLSSYDRATALVSSDWRRWGDCTFLMDKAHISSSGNVAWVSTIGYVKFDMCRLLILPLRLSAVMVKETDSWRFQQMQFQFDLDVTSLLVTIVVLSIWLLWDVVSLAVVTVKRVRNARRGPSLS